VGAITIIVFAAFALMLSTITRNTAASVAISIAFVFIGSAAVTVLKLFLSGEWLKFIPFNNIDISDRVFPPIADTMGTSYLQSGSQGIPLSFSLCYIAVIMFLIIYTGLDSFKRRDIK